MAGARMVGMAVRDQRTRNRPQRIDVKIVGRAIEAGWSLLQKLERTHAGEVMHGRAIDKPWRRVELGWDSNEGRSLLAAGRAARDVYASIRSLNAGHLEDAVFVVGAELL